MPLQIVRLIYEAECDECGIKLETDIYDLQVEAGWRLQQGDSSDLRLIEVHCHKCRWNVPDNNNRKG